MKTLKHLLIVGLLTIVSEFSSAQIVIDNTLTPQQLVQDVLVGQGVQVSNITFTGAAAQIGYFDATNGNFPIQSGVALSTGDVLDLPGAAANFASTIMGVGGDADLNTISSANTNDAAVLEFDFIPSGDSIIFTYVFGSEEYPEWVNSSFNDVFAFIISGPGFAGPFANGGENIALIPGTNQPVTIDNVNNVTPSNPQYYVDNTNGTAIGIVFDGHTVAIQARALVQCGQPYHLKFAIADAGDSSFDSGVFLEAESFSSNIFAFDIITPSLDSTIVEGCTTAEVNIYSPPSDSLLAYDIIVSGNAIEGVDYTAIPDSLIIQPGDSVFTFSIDALNDGILETGIDTIILTIYTINSCGDSVENVGVIYITQDYEIDVEIAETPGPCTAYDYSILEAILDGGNPAFQYHWSTGAVTSTIEVGFAQSTVVSVYVEDLCGFLSDTAYLTVDPGEIPPQPAVNVSNDVVLSCPGDMATLTAIGQGGSQPFSYTWSPAAGNGSTVTVQPNATTDYIVTVTDNCLLAVQDTITVTVEPYTPPSVSVADTSVLCPGDLMILTPTISGGNEPLTYSWSDGSGQPTLSLNPDVTESVTVTVTDDCGTTATGSIEVEVPAYDELSVTVSSLDLLTSDTVTICELWSDTVFSSVSGGLSPYALNWSGTLVEAGSINNATAVIRVNYELPADSSVFEMYSLTVVDQCGEELVVELPVNVISCDVVAPSIFNPNSTFQGTTDFCGSTPQNNVFNLPCLELYPGNNMLIFDRWGRKCYETENYHLNPWDGGNQSSGTYYYVCELPNGKEPVKGYFQLAR
ncbi:MAG: hypothetical protein RL266_2822 [Bacteroidota bacterium]